MLDSQRGPIHPERGAPLPDYPHAPIAWMPEDAQRVAEQDGLKLTEQHWEVIRALQAFYAQYHDTAIDKTELHDALDEKFHHQGGMKFLYRLLPKGPVAQGCRLAGLEPPAGAVDLGFGSVM